MKLIFAKVSQSVMERTTESEKAYFSSAVVDAFKDRETYGRSTSWLTLREKI